jgi:DNA-binding CsgD family transcriptional regulator
MADSKISTGSLSPREKEVMALLGKGYRNAHVATLLQISPKTVSSHCASMRYKLRINDQNGLIHFAIAHQNL